MAIGIIATGAANYPQTGAGRTWLKLIADVARRVGGANDGGRLDLARASCEAAVRAYNVVLWKFNQTTEDVPLVAATDSYTLNGYHAAPVRAHLINSSSKQVGEPLIWVNYTNWLDASLMEDSQGSDPPVWYTALNHHKLGKAVIRPVPLAPATGTYPTVRFTYLTRIEIPGSDADALNVPTEVEHGIERWANAEIISIVHGPGRGSEMMRDAVFTKTELEARYRAFPDY